MEEVIRLKEHKCWNKLKELGHKTKGYINNTFTEKVPEAQFIAASILTSDEIKSSDFTEFDNFIHYLGENPESTGGVVYYNRTAVLVNGLDGQHGECRLFDNDKKLLNKIIDENDGPPTNGRTEQKTYEGGSEVLSKMLKAYPDTTDGFIVLYSVNIPCSIPYHECAKLLNMYMYAESTKHKLLVGYDQVHKDSKEMTSLNWLDAPPKIKVFEKYDRCTKRKQSTDESVHDLEDIGPESGKKVDRKNRKYLQRECQNVTRKLRRH